MAITLRSVKGAPLTFNEVDTNFEELDKSLYDYAAKTANYTITNDDQLVVLTSGNATFTLPTAAGISGQYFTLKNASTGTLTVDTTSSQTIDGVTTQTVRRYDAMKVVSDGANWLII